MWHNSEQHESGSLLNLNRTPTPRRNVQEWRIKLSTLSDPLLPLRRATGARRGKRHQLCSLTILLSLYYVRVCIFLLLGLFSDSLMSDILWGARLPVQMVRVVFVPDFRWKVWTKLKRDVKHKTNVKKCTPAVNPSSANSSSPVTCPGSAGGC